MSVQCQSYEASVLFMPKNISMYTYNMPMNTYIAIKCQGKFLAVAGRGACLGQRDYSISPEVIARWRGKALSLLGRRGPFWSGKHVRGTVRSCLFSQSPQWPFLHVNHPLLHTCIIIVAVTIHFLSHFCFQYIVLLSTHNVLCLQQEVGWRGEQCLGSF